MPPVVAVVGPTASGKSDLAIDLAVRLGGELVNVDAYQVYRGMDVGTAKTPVAERRGVPHHLVDVLDVTETASVAEFQQMARAAVADCRARGVVPVLAGGSALYVRAVLDPLEFPGTDPAVRARWDAELEARGPEHLHALLVERDPDAAAQILPSNGRRLVRALEVVELTGSFTATMPGFTSVYEDVVMVGLDLPRAVLDERIADRVDRMWAQGLVAEVESLLPLGLAGSPTASRALGYQQVLAFLAGDLTEDEAREQTVVGTRKFARRQERFFRKDPRVRWLPHDAVDLGERAVGLVDWKA